MPAPVDTRNPELMNRIRRLRFFAAFVLVVESLLVSFWGLFAWAGAFAGLWLVSVPDLFGQTGRLGTSLVFFAGSALLVARGFYLFRLPDREHVDRALENASMLPHRPLRSLDDTLSNPLKPVTRSFWQHRTQEFMQLLKRLRAPSVSPVVPARDPYALRSAAAILFIVGLVVAGQTAPERLNAGLFPYDFKIKAFAADTAVITVTPPAYTRQPAFTLQGSGGDRTPSIPEGSKVKATVAAGFGHPFLYMDDHKFPLEPLGDRNFVLETEIRDGQVLRLRQGLFTRLKWSYTYVRDTPPAIATTGDTEVLGRAELRIPLTVTDDYGVSDLRMRMDINPMVTDRPIGEPFEETRTIMAPPGADTELQPVYSLSHHTWAGLPVLLTFTAIDAKGQKTSAEPVSVTLPERDFSHPVARRLIALRKRLAWERERAAGEGILELESIIREPDLYQGDTLVLLALRSSSSRLLYAPNERTVHDLIRTLWGIAVHLEDGDLSLALTRLRESQRKLEQALRDPNATDKDIVREMHALQDALADYLREFQRDLQKRLAEEGRPPILPSELLGQMLSPEDFAEFFDHLESEALSGDKSKAQELLSQMNRLMETLDPSLAMPMPEDLQAMMNGVDDLQELIRKQELLLDQTRSQAGRMRAPDLPSDKSTMLPPSEDFGTMPPTPELPQSQGARVDTQINKAEQEALRLILGQLMRESGEALDNIPEQMGLAEQEMRGSSGKLGENRPDLAAPHQEKAIEYLRQSMQSLANQMMARMEQMTGIPLGQSKTDPLGRRMTDKEGKGFLPGSRVKIPDEGERKRVEEILKLLRRKSGEFDRPEEELDYYRRLLKQF